MLSAVIIARDEGDRIEDAIRSVQFADECLVLDSGSRDDTIAKARALGAEVLETDWPGFCLQKNRAWSMAKGEWVLSLDADERVSPELARSIQQAILQDSLVGFRVKRRNIYLGRPLRGGHWYPDARLRLARKTAGRWVGQDPHDHLSVEGPVGALKGDLLHLPYRSLMEHLRTVDRYTSIAAREALASGKKASWLDLWLRPPLRVLSEFVVKGGWKDGPVGLWLALVSGAYAALKWCRIAGLLPMGEGS